MKMSWGQFKNLVDVWRIHGLVRFTPLDNGSYNLVWCNFDEQMFETGTLVSGTSDFDDFEQNYMPTPGTVWVSGMDVDRNDVAASFTASASGVTSYDMLAPGVSGTFLWGGECIVEGNSNLDGDQMQVQVVDKDGVYGQAGTVLRTFITKIFITQARIIDVASPDGSPSFIYPGLYLRFNYTETQGVSKNVDINLITMS